MQVFTRARGADVSLRDVTIAQMGTRATECGWCHSPEARGGFLEIWKSQLVEFCRPKKKGDFRLLAEALGRCRTRLWGVQMKKPE